LARNANEKARKGRDMFSARIEEKR
jgi:hypothetical protein